MAEGVERAGYQKEKPRRTRGGIDPMV